MDEVCIDVGKEPITQEVKNEDLPREINKSKEARLDISALDFWTTGQRAFFYVRVFNIFAQRHGKMAAEKWFRAIENEKKEAMVIECCKLKMGPSLPWSLPWSDGGMGKECTQFYKTLAEIIADKRKRQFR